MKSIVYLMLFLSFYFSQADKLTDYYNQLCSKKDLSPMIQCCAQNKDKLLSLLLESGDIVNSIPTCGNINMPSKLNDVHEIINTACHLPNQGKEDLIKCFQPFFNKFIEGKPELIQITEGCLSK